MAEPNEPLTERELEIVRLVSTGQGNKEIAGQLYLSPNTVKVHLRNIFTKLDAKSRTEVTMIAMRNGWIAFDQATRVSTLPSDQTVPSSVPMRSDEPVPADNHAIDSSPAVAPNPQALPRLPLWKRAALLAAAVAIIFLVSATLPVNQGTASSGTDPLRIVPVQARTSLLIRGEASRWHLRSPLPAPRARGTAVSIGSAIYLIGGEVDQVVSGDIMVFQPMSNTWDLVSTSKPTPVANTAAVVVDHRIYVAGGTGVDGAPSRSLEVFDTDSRKWHALAPLPRPVAGHALASLSNQLFLFGGADDRGVTGDSYRYDPADDTWRRIASIPTPRTLTAAAVLDDRIYVVGGFNNGRELASCEYYQYKSDSWGSCAPMTVPRSGLGLARVGTSIFAVGGGVSGFVGFSERYETASDRWTPLETPITSDWQNVAVASQPTEFYVFGGYSGGERLALTYVYEVFTNRAFVPAFQSPGPRTPAP